MVNTKFGKRLFGLFLAFICVFALIGCNKDAQIKETALKDAQEKVDEIYSKIFWEKSAMSQITGNLILNTTTMYENVVVEWESSEEDVISTSGKVTLPMWEDERAVVYKEATEDEPAEKVLPVKITAKIIATAEWEVKGKTYTQEVTATKEFNFTVKVLAEGVKIESIANAKANAAKYIYDEMGVERKLVSNSNIVYSTGVKGVVTAMLQASGSGQFMIHDGTEGIYVYKSFEGLQVGDSVTVFGDIYSYYGSLQFGSNINITIEPKGSSEIGEYRETTPEELETEGSALLEDGKSLAKAGYYGGELVNVYGLLKQKDATGGSSDKYVLLDASTGEELWIYYKSYAKTDVLDQYVDKYVKMRGVTYDRDSRLLKCEILWDGTIEEAAAPSLTDEEKVAVALASITAPARAEEDFDLATEAVWEVVSGTAIVVENGVAKVTKGEKEETVTLRATVTIGSASDSKEFEVTVPAATLDIITIAEALELAGTDGSYTEAKYYVQGVIVSIASETYGNMTIKDATGELYVYGVYSKDGQTRYDALEVKPQVGEVITLYGVLGSYKGSQQMKSGWLAEHYVTTSITDAAAIGAAKEHNTYTEEKYYVTAEIKEVYNTTYGNMYIKDAEGNELTVYGTYSADGQTRYDALEVKPQAGDTIVVYGVLGQYKDTPQMKNGWIVFHLPAEGDPTPEPDPEPNPEVKYETSVEAGVEYYLSFYQEQNAKHLFPNGEMSGYYGATVENAADAKKVALEATEGGYYLYFVGDTKTYINVVASVSNGKTYNNVKYQSEATSVWTFNEEYDTLTTVVGETTVYLGTYGTNVTVGASAISYAATSYVAHLYKVENAPVNGTVEPDPEPTEGTTVKVSIADYADKNSWVNSTKYNTVILDENVTVEATGTDSNTGKYYESGENWRMYQTGTPSIVFTAKEGYVIKTVKVTYASQNTGALTLNGTTVASDTAVEVNASSVTFSVGNTGDATNGQARISAIEVVYASVTE